jgi:ATP-binding cassette subfamily F protein uup
MASPPLISLRGVRVTFGSKPLFDDLDVTVGAGDRLGLIGRNGVGKSTLLRLLEGGLDPDAGKRAVQTGVRIAHLQQDPRLDGGLTALAFAAEGGGEEHLILAGLDQLGVSPDARIDALSGGQSRRVALVRAIAAEPDVLLLDEPTNHLDLPSIEWLEAEVARFRGGMVVIIRSYLSAPPRAAFWLRRGPRCAPSEGLTFGSSPKVRRLKKPNQRLASSSRPKNARSWA